MFGLDGKTSEISLKLAYGGMMLFLAVIDNIAYFVQVIRGAPFTLHFPATREAMVKDQHTLTIEQYRGNDQTILIVDDVAVQRELVAGAYIRQTLFH